MTDSLFSQSTNDQRPLADRLRPATLDDVVGQQQRSFELLSHTARLNAQAEAFKHLGA